MGGHKPTPNEQSNPLAWTIGLLASTFLLLFGFTQFMTSGSIAAQNKPIKKPDASASGPAEPDHAALIQAVLDDPAGSMSVGKRVYAQACTACHGVDGGEPKLAGARNYLTEPIMNGSDPYGIYKTIAYGYGTMAAQRMKPEEAYAVAWYVRESFMKQNSQAGYVDLGNGADYLAAGGWPPPNAGGGEGDKVDVLALKNERLPFPVAALMLEAGAAADELQAQLEPVRTRLIDSGRYQWRVLGEDPRNSALLQQIVQAADAGDATHVRNLLQQPGLTVAQTDALSDANLFGEFMTVVTGPKEL